VGLVGDEERDGRDAAFEPHRPEGVVRGDRDTPFAKPEVERGFALESVEDARGERRELPDLDRPVADDARRADDEEVGGPLGETEVAHRRERLDRLAEPHLVAEDRLLHGEDVPGAEHLVLPQVPVGPEAVESDRVGLHLPGDLVGKAAGRGGGAPERDEREKRL